MREVSTGRPNTDVEGHTFDADEGDYDRVNGPFRGARNPTFHQVDVRVEKTWVYDTWMLGLYLEMLDRVLPKVSNVYVIDKEASGPLPLLDLTRRKAGSDK